MVTSDNRQWLLRSYPDGIPGTDNFEQVTAPTPDLADGQILVEPIYQSMDPLPRVRLNPDNGRIPPLPLGSVMIGRAVGRVLASRDEAWAVGDIACGEMGWQERAVVAAQDMTPVDATLAPISTALGVLGPSGIAAYVSLIKLGEPQPGNTVLVPAAAGSVGSVVCQIARLKGCRVVAIASGEQEQHYLRNELGLEKIVDWRDANFESDLADALPDGIDVFIDLVGGNIHNLAMRHINVGARVALVGYVSAYNASGEPQNYGDIYAVIHKRAVMRGFLAPDHRDMVPQVLRDLSAWIQSGELTYSEHIEQGFEQLPAAFAHLFSGFHPGKKLVQVSEH
tara:strand:- start:143483 stop:144496 length:1014 start_codon:yes stop_codon:yes gene_type:complete